MTVARDVLEYVVRPTLAYLDPEIPHTSQAEGLLMGIAAHESKLGNWLDQTVPGPGPAYGIFQMEEITAYDVIKRATPGIRNKLLEISILISNNRLLDLRELHGNWYLAAALCRAYLYLQPFTMPIGIDPEQFASIWKRYYNTVKGKGTTKQFLKSWNALIEPAHLWEP